MAGHETLPSLTHKRLVTRLVEELRPHPSYIRHHLSVSASQLSALAEAGESAFHEPIFITHEGTIVDGYARWQLAQIQNRTNLACIEYELTEEEALRHLLQRHRRSNGLNDFVRIVLALELEPAFRKKAQLNQRIGGQTKDLSKLTDAQRLDVRSEIASAAGVSVGNVTKVKQVMARAHPSILQALQRGEIRIHRAWTWSNRSPSDQQEALSSFQSERGTKKTIRNLIARHRSKYSPQPIDLDRVLKQLSRLDSEMPPVHLRVMKGLGRTVIVSEELLGELTSTESCAANTP